MNSKVRTALIGWGVMGKSHAHDLHEMEETELVVVCDTDRSRADQAAALYGCQASTDYHELLEHNDLDAVVVAVPHYDHTPISIDFLQRGVHVLVEKPLAVHVKDGLKMIEAYTQAHRQYPALQFAIMLQMRVQERWKILKAMLDGGELGGLVRATWLITDWFRTQSYYDNGGWRATWGGEGGGVLLNQCPHNLDLYQWFFGLPRRITGFAAIGKYHRIEVEDEVTAFFEHENGMIGHFITTTAESPGTNRLEIVGEKGKLVMEEGRLLFYRNRSSMFEFIRTFPGSFDKVEFSQEEVLLPPPGQQSHRLVLQNFAGAILHGEALVAPAPEGLNGLSLGNAIMLSHFQGRPVELPLDGEDYASRLEELARSSHFNKEVHLHEDDLNKSFH